MKLAVLACLLVLTGCTRPLFGGGGVEGTNVGVSQEVPAPRGPVYERAYRWLQGSHNYRIVQTVTNQSIRAENILGNGGINVIHATFSGGNLSTRVTVDAWTDIVGEGGGRRRADLYDGRLPLEVDAFFANLSCQVAQWDDCP